MSLIELKAWYKLNFGSEIHKSQLVLQKLKVDAFKTSTYITSWTLLKVHQPSTKFWQLNLLKAFIL
jgi:hypothetical protein